MTIVTLKTLKEAFASMDDISRTSERWVQQIIAMKERILVQIVEAFDDWSPNDIRGWGRNHVLQFVVHDSCDTDEQVWIDGKFYGTFRTLLQGLKFQFEWIPANEQPTIPTV